MESRDASISLLRVSIAFGLSFFVVAMLGAAILTNIDPIPTVLLAGVLALIILIVTG